jgi:hypothetical protein
MSGACSTHGRYKNAHKILVGKHEEGTSLEGTRLRWEDVKTVDWIQLAQDRDQLRALVDSVMNLQKAGNILTS